MQESLKKVKFKEIALDEPFCLMAKALVWYKKLGSETYDKEDSGRKADPDVVLPRDFRVREPDTKYVFVRPVQAMYRVNYSGTDPINGGVKHGFMIMEKCDNATAAAQGAFEALQKRPDVKDAKITRTTFLDYNNP